MSYGTSLPERKIMGFTIVNYTGKALFNVFFVSLLMAGFCVLMGANFFGFSVTTGLLMWLALTLGAYALIMKCRNRVVRREIEEGRHDPVWGKHICRLSQSEADAFHESHWLTRPLFRLACLLGVHKKE